MAGEQHDSQNNSGTPWATQWSSLNQGQLEGTSEVITSNPFILHVGETEAQNDLMIEVGLLYRFHLSFTYSLSTRHKRLPFLKEGETDLKTDNYSVSGKWCYSEISNPIFFHSHILTCQEGV